MEKERKYYMVRIRDNINDFANKGVIAVGWSNVDFSNDKNEVLKRVDSEYYQTEYYKEHTIIAGRKKKEIERLLNISEGDILIVPCYQAFYICTATNKWIYDQSQLESDLSNQLVVEYIKDDSGNPYPFMRADKNTALQTKLKVRGFTTLEIDNKDIIGEINRLFNSKKDTAYSSTVIEKQSKNMEHFRQEIAKRIGDYSSSGIEAGGFGFEKLIEKLFKKSGYKTKILSKNSGKDEGDADVLAVHESPVGSEFNTAFFIQAKHYNGDMDNWAVEQIKKFRDYIDYEYDNIFGNEEIPEVPKANIHYAVITSANNVSEKIKEEARENDIIFIDAQQLSAMLFERFDELDEYQFKLGYVKMYKHISEEM